MTTACTTLLPLWPGTLNLRQMLIMIAIEVVLGLKKPWFYAKSVTFRTFELGPAVHEIRRFEGFRKIMTTACTTVLPMWPRTSNLRQKFIMIAKEVVLGSEKPWFHAKSATL